ncbi:MAG TPA: acyl-CoA thioesterase [Puia sp.]|jgi:YbgC/YbaW family acyl-CoA thioester hydrolase|nr:acyl-CoA thioesterase [Puia sp.]
MEKTPFSSYTVRFNDCDPMGHLNNARYIDYFLNAREDHLREFYGIDLREWASQGIGFVVTRHEIRYLRQVTYNDRVGIQSSLIGWGETWLLVEMQMLDAAGQLKAILWTEFTRIDPRTGKRLAHPAEFMEWIQGTLVEDVEVEKGLGGRVEVLRERAAQR